MYTIALQGVENTGKTETLNLLIDLINKGGVFSDIEIRYINERNPNNKHLRSCGTNKFQNLLFVLSLVVSASSSREFWPTGPK